MNIMPISNIMAERYPYIPSLGFCMFLGILMLKIHARIPRPYHLFMKAYFIGILIFYLTCTISHSRIWFNKSTLWSRTVYNTSCSFNAHTNLGTEYLERGLIDKAIEEYTIALSKASEVQYVYPTAHYNLGIAYDAKGMYDASVMEYKNALRIDPNSGDIHNNLGLAFFYNKQVNSAIEELNKAITLDPNNSIYHQNLAKIYYEINMPDKAKVEQDLANRLKLNLDADLR